MYKLIPYEEAKILRSNGFIHIDIKDHNRPFRSLFGAEISMVYSQYMEAGGRNFTIFKGILTGTVANEACAVSNIIIDSYILKQNLSKGLIYEFLSMTILELIELAKSSDRKSIIVGSDLPMLIDIMVDSGFEIIPKNNSMNLNQGTKKLEGEKVWNKKE